MHVDTAHTYQLYIVDIALIVKLIVKCVIMLLLHMYLMIYIYRESAKDP